MKLVDALDFVAAQRPAWKTPAGSWRDPFSFNRDHLLRLLGPNRDVRKITKADLAQLRNTLMSEPARPGSSKKRSIGGVNRILSLLTTLLRDLEDNEVIVKAPKLKSVPENNARTAYFRKEQVMQMVTVSKDIYAHDALADAILVAAFTGCRQSELLGLTVGDVDLYANRMCFRNTKNGEDHVVDIHEDLRPILRRLCHNRAANARVFDSFKNDDDLRRAFYKVRDLCGLGPEYVFHTLRHSTATWLAEKGIPLQTIAAVLNHKTIQTTQRYAKATDQARRAAINAL